MEALTIPYNQFFLNIIITLKISGDLVLKIEHNFEELEKNRPYFPNVPFKYVSIKTVIGIDI